MMKKRTSMLKINYCSRSGLSIITHTNTPDNTFAEIKTECELFFDSITAFDLYTNIRLEITRTRDIFYRFVRPCTNNYIL